MNQSIVGILWMVITTILFVGVTAAVRYLEGEIPAPQAAFLRYAIGTVLLTPSLISLVKIRPEKPLLQKFVLRGLVHSIGVTLWFYAMSVMPVAEVTAIGFLTYIFVSIGACIFLKEKLHKHRLTAILFSFVGAMIILRPGLNVIDPASFIVIGAAFCYALAYITTKSMTKTEHPLAVLFYMNLIQFLIAAIPVSFVWITPSLLDIKWILLVGIGGFFSHYCLTRAFQVADTLTVIPIDFMRLPIIAIIGYFFYNEGLDISLLFGAVIIFVGNYYNIRYESVQIDQSK